ncbi:hypothetical protein LIER_02239 [Lithospermum erythrorhizon]|uniref:Uncharacterized protein n=1 Tax=Lithospermum erythrorhizon TaxID=34254 RepID=A0AAV3NNS8_LITER
MTGKTQMRLGVSTRAESTFGDMDNPGLDVPPITHRRSQKHPRERAPGHARASSEGPRTPPQSTHADVNIAINEPAEQQIWIRPHLLGSLTRKVFAQGKPTGPQRSYDESISETAPLHGQVEKRELTLSQASSWTIAFCQA